MLKYSPDQPVITVRLIYIPFFFCVAENDSLSDASSSDLSDACQFPASSRKQSLSVIRSTEINPSDRLSRSESVNETTISIYSKKRRNALTLNTEPSFDQGLGMHSVPYPSEPRLQRQTATLPGRLTLHTSTDIRQLTPEPHLRSVEPSLPFTSPSLHHAIAVPVSISQPEDHTPANVHQESQEQHLVSVATRDQTVDLSPSNDEADAAGAVRD